MMQALKDRKDGDGKGGKDLNIPKLPGCPWTCPSSPGFLNWAFIQEWSWSWGDWRVMQKREGFEGVPATLFAYEGRGGGEEEAGFYWEYDDLPFSPRVPQRVKNAAHFRAACQRHIVSYSLCCSSFVLWCRLLNSSPPFARLMEIIVSSMVMMNTASILSTEDHSKSFKYFNCHSLQRSR